MKKTMSFIVGFVTVLGAGVALAQGGIDSVVFEEPTGGVRERADGRAAAPAHLPGAGWAAFIPTVTRLTWSLSPTAGPTPVTPGEGPLHRDRGEAEWRPSWRR